jgi:hypothetical protein
MQAVPFTSSAARPAQVSLCVGVQRAKASIHRGESAQWIVVAWAKGGNVPDAIIRLAASPSSVTPEFSFGCGSHDGSSACDLGAVDANSSQRQLQARVAVPATASAVTSVQLTAEVSAAHLPKNPAASAKVTVTAPAAGTSTTGTPTTSTSPLSVGTLPYLQSNSPTLTPGGNAGSLFPALSPSADPASTKAGAQQPSSRTVANTSALPLGAPVVGAQLIGLGALALAFVLAVTRLSIRRRPAAAAAGTAAAQSQPAPDQPVPDESAPAKPADPPKPADEDKPEPEADGGDILES